MSKDIIMDLQILEEHPKRITALIDQIAFEVEAAHQEGYDLYRLISEQEQHCKEKMQELYQEYRDTKNQAQELYSLPVTQNTYTPKFNERAKLRYKDAQEIDLYTGDLKQKQSALDDCMNELHRSKELLESAAQQIVNIQKTVEDLQQNKEQWNEIYIITLQKLMDLNS